LKILYLLRHAKAEAIIGKEKDIDRSLSEVGRQVCSEISQYLQDKNYQPDLVLCSPSKRTLETNQFALKHLKQPKIEVDKGLYLAHFEDMVSKINLINDDVVKVMLIGHNPGIHNLALALTETKNNELYFDLENKYPTGSLAVLKFDCKYWRDVQLKTGNLLDFKIFKKD
jgi:phosphohistidine phosphatase